MTHDVGDRVYVLTLDTYGIVKGEEDGGTLIVDTAVGHPLRGEVAVAISDIRSPKNVPLGDMESIGI